MKISVRVTACFIAALISLSGCVSQTVKTTKIPAIQTPVAPIPNEQLLDVSIAIFDPGLDIEQEGDIPVFPEVRQSEARYMPQILMSAMQDSGAWGAVRVVPSEDQLTDLMIEGKILHSDGSALKIEITAYDATGRVWVNSKVYDHTASRYAYAKTTRQQEDPFAALYINIANDLFVNYRDLTVEEVRGIRQLSELRFAERFASSAFAGYVSESNGIFKPLKLPSPEDAMLQRVKKLRQVNNAFVDALLLVYDAYSDNIRMPYTNFRAEISAELQHIETLRAEQRSELTGLGLTLASVIFAANNPSKTGVQTRSGNEETIDLGEPINRALQRSNEIKMYVSNIESLSAEFIDNVEPTLIRLDDSVISMEGSVEDQYTKWRTLLEELYQLEMGSLPEILPQSTDRKAK